MGYALEVRNKEDSCMSSAATGMNEQTCVSYDKSAGPRIHAVSHMITKMDHHHMLLSHPTAFIQVRRLTIN